jgi:hypothetical protein
MLLLPFLAILMVPSLGHVSGEKTFSIPMLADFGTKILKPVIRSFQREVNAIEGVKILCESANALDKEFMAFL